MKDQVGKEKLRRKDKNWGISFAGMRMQWMYSTKALLYARPWAYLIFFSTSGPSEREPCFESHCGLVQRLLFRLLYVRMWSIDYLVALISIELQLPVLELEFEFTYCYM